MPSFILRDIPEDFWRQFKSKASLQGLTLKAAVRFAARPYTLKRITMTTVSHYKYDGYAVNITRNSKPLSVSR